MQLVAVPRCLVALSILSGPTVTGRRQSANRLLSSLLHLAIQSLQSRRLPLFTLGGTASFARRLGLLGSLLCRFFAINNRLWNPGLCDRQVDATDTLRPTHHASRCPDTRLQMMQRPVKRSPPTARNLQFKSHISSAGWLPIAGLGADRWSTGSDKVHWPRTLSPMLVGQAVCHQDIDTEWRFLAHVVPLRQVPGSKLNISTLRFPD